MPTASPILQALYQGDRKAAERAAAIAEALDVFEAAALGRIAQLRLLAESAPECTRGFGGDGFTALQLAAFFAQPEAVRVLLDHGADINAVSKNEMRVQALHSAAVQGNPEVMRLLLAAGADPNARQAGGYTALQARASRGDAEMTRLLLAHGADPEIKAEDGRTAIELALAGSHAEVVALLRRPNCSSAPLP
jgi:ankyrin repeat protein